MSLSKIASETRAILKWGGIFLVSLILLFFILKVKDILFPAPPPAPTVGFGKLPSIDFPKTSVNKNLTYTLDTITGSLPSFPVSQKVFKMQQIQPDLLSLPKASEKAKSIGFENKPDVVSENVYQWKNTGGKILTMNILNFNFNFSSDYLSSPNTPIFGKSAEIAVSTSKDFLGKMGLLFGDLDDTKTKTELFAIKNFKLIQVASLSSAQVVKVNFFQKPLNGLPIFYAGLASPLNILVEEIKNEPQVVEANFFYQKPSDSFSTYPLKSARQAYDALKNGRGYITTIPLTSKIAIKKVSLGYYISDKKQDYLLPIVIFEGDNFQAYVTAVKDEWVSK